MKKRVLSELEPDRRQQIQLRADCHSHSQQCRELTERVGALERTLEALTGDFTAQMTVHQAWARHPGVAEVFARRGLPACPDCPVGDDETLAEVAFGYQLDLDQLLGELRALLRG